MSKTAYVAGPIHGKTKKVARKPFETAAAPLLESGYTVLFPTCLAGNVEDELHEGHDSRETRITELRRMLSVDEIHMLPDWQTCATSTMLRMVALSLGTPDHYL